MHKPRDPRFDGVSGAVDLGLVQHAYGFVDEARAQELKELEEALRLTQEPEAREDIVERIHLLRDQERVRRVAGESKRLSGSPLAGSESEAAGPRTGRARQSAGEEPGSGSR